MYYPNSIRCIRLCSHVPLVIMPCHRNVPFGNIVSFVPVCQTGMPGLFWRVLDNLWSTQGKTTIVSLSGLTLVWVLVTDWLGIDLHPRLGLLCLRRGHPISPSQPVESSNTPTEAFTADAVVHGGWVYRKL